MARRSAFYFCHCCNRTRRYHITSSVDVCNDCHEDLVALFKLYTRIVAKYPVFRRVRVGQVMLRLWAYFEKHSGDPLPPVERVEPPPIDELDKVF